MKFQPPKGTRDFWGDEFYFRQGVINTILSVMERYGFRQAASPMFESLDLLVKDAGEEISGQIYRITDKAGRIFGLKSDITPAMTRIVANQGKSIMKPIKIACSDRVYRYERPQKGRYREIYQVNAEMFGVKSAASDAELIRCFYDCYRELGLGEVKILIGYRPLLKLFVASLVNADLIKPLIRLIDKKDKIGLVEFESEVKKLRLDGKQIKQLLQYLELSGSPSKIIQLAETILKNGQFKEYLDNLREIVGALEDYQVSDKCELNLGVARGSEYYTGVIFEARYLEQEDKSIGGGGRYDNLVEFYGGSSTPATGFSIGVDRVCELLTMLGKNKNVSPSIDYYIASETNSKTLKITRQLATKLRAKNKKVEINLTNDYLGEQLMIAKKMGAKKIIILKKDLLTEKKVKVIDVETEKEVTVSQVRGIEIC